MVPVGEDPPAGLSANGFQEGSLIGKRYTDDAATVEVLCTKAGTSSLSLGDEALVLKDAKPLPSSDCRADRAPRHAAADGRRRARGAHRARLAPRRSPPLRRATRTVGN